MDRKQAEREIIWKVENLFEKNNNNQVDLMLCIFYMVI